MPFEVITNIKMKDLVNFTSSSEDGKIYIFAPQVSTHLAIHAYVKFLSRSQRF